MVRCVKGDEKRINRGRVNIYITKADHIDLWTAWYHTFSQLLTEFGAGLCIGTQLDEDALLWETNKRRAIIPTRWYT